MLNFTDFTALTLTQLERDIHGFIGACELPSPLCDASIYAMTNGGKRVRPLLVVATFLTLKSPSDKKTPILPSDLRRAMLAVECLHGYSLIHDDLPCMDDDALRRGRPTAHIVYGEAVAMLAGDVLQTLAFEAFTHVYFGEEESDENLIPKTSELLAIFAPRARRMVMGQMLDLSGEERELSQGELEAIHRDKTGALIEASVLTGAICGNATDKQISALQLFAQNIGLAFQVQDDILDVTSSTETLGKPSGSDEKLDKSTYVKLLGVEPATRYAQQLFKTAEMALIKEFGEKNLLIDLANWLWARQK